MDRLTEKMVQLQVDHNCQPPSEAPGCPGEHWRESWMVCERSDRLQVLCERKKTAGVPNCRVDDGGETSVRAADSGL